MSKEQTEKCFRQTENVKNHCTVAVQQRVIEQWRVTETSRLLKMGQKMNKGGKMRFFFQVNDDSTFTWILVVKMQRSGLICIQKANLTQMDCVQFGGVFQGARKQMLRQWLLGLGFADVTCSQGQWFMLRLQSKK